VLACMYALAHHSHHWMQPSTLLNLPVKYKELHDKFASLDFLVARFGAHKTCVFSKVKLAVESQLRRTFSLENLAQICHIFPEAYELEQVYIFDRQAGTGEHQLKILAKPGSAQPRREGTVTVLTTSDLHARNEEFRYRLVDLVKTHHQAHLDTLPVKVKIPKEKLQRWAKNFDLENVPGEKIKQRGGSMFEAWTAPSLTHPPPPPPPSPPPPLQRHSHERASTGATQARCLC
jgi:hypothetical protein